MPVEILESRIAPASFVVTTLADSGNGSLRSAITGADLSTDSTNTILFVNKLEGSINLKSPLPAITNNMTIGGATTAKIAINGENVFQLFNIQSPSNPITVTINDLILAHGNSQNGGGTNVQRGGGAIYINDYSGTVTVNRCTITKNYAIGTSGATETDGVGAGIDLIAGKLNINTSFITGNLAVGGHGLNPGDHGANAKGGGLYVANSNGIVSILSTLFFKNAAVGGNGLTGTHGVNGATDSTADGGQGGAGGVGQGGGIWSYGTITTNKSTISGNVAYGGAGGSGGAGGNGAPGGSGGTGGPGGGAGNGFGGGVYSTGSLTLNSSTVSGNIALGNFGGRGGAGGRPGRGRGIFATGARGSTLPRATGYGGGIHSNYATLDVVDSTIAQNLSDQGGGLFLYNNTSTKLENSTIAFNGAFQGGQGGGLWSYLETGDPITVISTVIGQNATGMHGPGQDLFVSNGSITSTYSLIESYNAGSVTDPGTISTTILGANPLLGALGKNGGPTYTCRPLSFANLRIVSPLIGTGSNPLDLSRDQRGSPREIGMSTDIGAVEVA